MSSLRPGPSDLVRLVTPSLKKVRVATDVTEEPMVVRVLGIWFLSRLFVVIQEPYDPMAGPTRSSRL